MTNEQIASHPPGPALDNLVHEIIYSGQGKRRAYSSTKASYELLEVIPGLVVGRGKPTDPGHNPAKPYWAGIVEQIADDGGTRYTTTVRLFSTSLSIALCKVALMAMNSRPTAK